MSTLVPVQDFAAAKFVTEKAFDEIASPGYLSRLQLFGANSEPVKEGKFPMAHFGLVIAKDQIKDLGKEVDIIPLSLRFKALRFKDGENVVYYNPESAEFKKVMVDSESTNSGCMYGPEFLVFVPNENTYSTLLFGSKSSRKEGRQVRTLLGQGATLKNKLVRNKTYSWHVPFVVACSNITNIPDEETVKEQVLKFSSPEESSVEFDPAAMAGDEAAPERPR